MAIAINAADVVLCEFYFSDLNQSKKRPVLVLKDDLPHNDFVGIPISSQLRELHQDEILVDSSKFSEGGLPKTSKVMERTNPCRGEVWDLNFDPTIGAEIQRICPTVVINFN